ncbi:MULTISPECIES: hypothetical protein [unclassified Chryseobacterium]|uniref:hypothetical protein n=1 Tax=unclassified Chryseobacterium TaxID=2593645 RepID=UPI00100A8C44|nr:MULTISPECIES: hypothetical protein [unclassified Chryseobacterium]RXM50407.1 hypothetical protein BOQ64_18475 [Chryseobacterium sp. CH25]RXM64547.1 hypothetical protein BOQ60_09965 [Chryseobacterium sp. CH1]
MKISSTLLIILISITGFAQNTSDKKFDQEAFEYLDKTTEKESASLETFLFYSKPFSKWDIRPLEEKQVRALDSIYSSSQIPNFIWGAFSNKYELPEKVAMNKPNIFLNEGINAQSNWNSHFKKNIKIFNTLSEYILKSPHKIYLNQSTIQRIDDIYKENNVFWSYLINKNSPYPISPEITIKNKIKFSNEDIEILSLIKKLNFYCAIRTNKGIFYIIDGFTDNSYGIYYSSKNEMEQDNHLFQIMKYEPLDKQYFYFIAN